MFNNFTCEKCGRRLGNSSLCPDCDRDMLIDGIATVAKRGGTNQCLEQWLCNESRRPINRFKPTVKRSIANLRMIPFN